MDFVMPTLSSKNNKLYIGKNDICELADKYGTPLYVMDEDYIRNVCREFQTAMKEHYGDNALISFASKAFCATYMYKILEQEKFGADVVSGGELYTALNAGFPPEKLTFHGNNKTRDEMVYAIRSGVGRFVVDGLDELDLLNEVALEMGCKVNCLFRIKPGVDAHTHEFIQTGNIDSKFGFALETGAAFNAIKRASCMSNINACGIHCHIGSQIFESEPFVYTVNVMLGFVKELKDKLNVEIDELNLGGGFGIRYVYDDKPNSITDMVKLTAETVKEVANKLGLKLPKLMLEPGRIIVGASGLTVYKVGGIKEIPNVRNYISVDGGMTDNPRYALYNAAYSAVLPNRVNDRADYHATIAGRCCESGDILGKDFILPKPKVGEYLCVLTTGAYNYSMASNYNRVPRPPVVMVCDGNDKLIVKRETYEDLVKNDL